MLAKQFIIKLIMANEVIKKDGTREAFDAEKIRRAIAAAAQDAGISEERQNELVEQITSTVVQAAEEKEEIATSEIREKILTELDAVEPAVSESWRRYEQEKTRA